MKQLNINISTELESDGRSLKYTYTQWQSEESSIDWTDHSWVCDDDLYDPEIQMLVQILYYYDNVFVNSRRKVELVFNVQKFVNPEDLTVNIWDWYRNKTMGDYPNTSYYLKLMSLVLDIESKGSKVTFC